MRKVGRVMCKGFEGSRATLAEVLAGGLEVGLYNEDVRRGREGDEACEGRASSLRGDLLSPRSRRSSSESESLSEKLSMLALRPGSGRVVLLAWF